MRPISDPKIDSQAVNGLSGTEDSLAYRVEEIEKHNHNSEMAFGNSSNDMASKVPIKFTVVGGDNAWGTELMLTDGTVIEGGSATKKFDLDTLYIVSVSTANKISIVEFSSSAINSQVACTFDFTGGTPEDKIVSVAHGLADDDKVVFKAGGGALPAEINDYTVYYVVNKDTDFFQVSLTIGGSVHEFTDDGGASFWYPISSSVQSAVQTTMTNTVISMAATNSDSAPYIVKSPRIGTNQRMFVRAKSETGQTISIGFLIGLHTYEA